MTTLTDDIRQKIKSSLTALPAAPEDHPRNKYRYRLCGDGEFRQVAGLFKHYASEALGVNPEQIDEAREFFKLNGCGDVEFTPDGRPVITCKSQFDAMAKALQLKHGAHGYGHINESGQFDETGKRLQDRRDELHRTVQLMVEGREEDANPNIVRMLDECFADHLDF